MGYVFDLACSGLTLVSSLLHWMWIGSEQMVLFYNTPVFSFHFSILCWHVRTWVPKNYSFSFQITFKRSKLTPQSLCMHFILFSWVVSMWVIKFIMVLVFYLAVSGKIQVYLEYHLLSSIFILFLIWRVPIPKYQQVIILKVYVFWSKSFSAWVHSSFYVD